MTPYYSISQFMLIQNCKLLSSLARSHKIGLVYPEKTCALKPVVEILSPYLKGMIPVTGNGPSILTNETQFIIGQRKTSVLRLNAEKVESRLKSRFGEIHVSKLKKSRSFHIYHPDSFWDLNSALRFIENLINFFDNQRICVDLLSVGGPFHKLEGASIKTCFEKLRAGFPEAQLMVEPERYFFRNSMSLNGNVLAKEGQRVLMNLSFMLHMRYSPNPRLVILADPQVPTETLTFLGPSSLENDASQFTAPHDAFEKVGAPIVFSNIFPISAAMQGQFERIPQAKVKIF